ncbi:LytR family transcriptional regulator [Peribacillus saganii]|uniref:LytR family transcriptional regulator n=1 Tax=Peribacillus saganii TaxID=2303992 RepID=A0A372LM76_9BACI|nr:LCP family protein [Peribacillus saganii]RFU68311.1 LytR family transcriptional regulator [Peribacillus saganii]
MYDSRRSNRVIKKKKKKSKLAFFLLTPLLLLALFVTVYGTFLYNKAENVVADSYEEMDTDIGSSEKPKEAVVKPDVNNTSILFIGVDDSNSRSFEEGTRSDALMLATFNEEEKSVKLLSIPRDSYVHVPGNDTYTKINHAYAIGGPSETVKTVEELLDIPVNYYVRMNFYAFIDVVDALNGVEVDVPYLIREKDTEDNRNAIRLEPGRQLLNGEEALAFARTRKKDNDLERGKRQQEVIQAIMSKATSVTSISKYTDVMEAVGDNMKTNMTFSVMKDYVAYTMAGTAQNIENLQLAGQDSRIDGVYYYELDEEKLEETQLILKQHLDLDSSTDLAQEEPTSLEQQQ